MKCRPIAPKVLEVANRIHTALGTRRPKDIDIDIIADHLGMRIVYGGASTAEGWSLQAGGHAIIHLDEGTAGRPRGRFTAAHEIGHLLLHPDSNQLALCTNPDAERNGPYHHREQEADDFAAALLIPDFLGAAFCQMPRPTVEDVHRLARTFRTSFEMSALRMVRLNRDAPCAVTLALNGRVKYAAETAPFPGKIVKRRELHPSSLARAVPLDGPAPQVSGIVPGEAWGSPQPLHEHSIPYFQSRSVLSWIIPT